MMLRISMAATAALLAGSLMTPASAADLGGNCCADLEERIAELEATTVRKGTRKVSVTLSGFVAHQVMWWDDGTQRDMYIGDGGNYGSRFRFVGTAKISADVTAGFLYEFGINNNSISSMNQLNGGDDLGAAGAPLLRDSTVWMEHKTLGRVKIGHGSTSTDNLVLIDLSGCGGACTPDVALYNGGFVLRAKNGAFPVTGTINSTAPTWQYAIRGHESWDTTRRNHIMYQSPTLHGFTLQAAVAEDNYWDIALRYAGEFGGFRIAGGIGYQSDSEFNSPTQTIDGVFSVQCTALCNVKTSEWKGALSVLHVASGLFLTGSAGTRELSGTSTGVAGSAYAGPDLNYWHLIGGISQNFFGIGRTVLFGEYGESSGGLAQAAYLGIMASHDITSDNDFTYWGLGITQNIDAASMEVFVTYKNFSLDAHGFTGGADVLNTGSAAGGASDMSTVMVGTRINF
jgi:hypothetical protein